MSSPEQVAQRIADDVLFPRAVETDRADLVASEQLDVLATAGLYGLSGPVDAGGLGCDARTSARVVEILASGCLATTFVWLQHQGVVRAVDAAATPIRAGWLAALCRGERRAGVAIAGIRPGVEPLRAHPVAGGFVLHGVAPWVTGWGLVDVVHTAALDPAGHVVWLLVDAVEASTLRVARQRLAAVDASSTVTVSFDGHRVDVARVTATTPYAQWEAADAAGLRTNGSLALGVVRRCASLLDDAELHARLEQARAALDEGGTDALPHARAAASYLAWQAAGALVVATGSRAVLADQHAQLLARQAMFLLVFGSRPAIRDALTEGLATAAHAWTAAPS